jgi:glyceraldehyde 3-phosphate dehydrogenase
MWCAGLPHLVAAPDLLTARRIDDRQIGHGNLIAGYRLDRHRLHPCNRPGERHPAGDRRRHDLTTHGGIVDSPVAGVTTRRCVAGDDGPVDRRAEAHGCDGKCNEHLPTANVRLSGFRFQGFAPNFEIEKRREMTAARIGLMGFGRIGRNVFRLLHDRDDLDIVAIADIAKPEALTYLLKYDSIYGRFPVDVEYHDGSLQYGSKTVSFKDSRAPADTDWGSLDVDIVLETTSRYRTRESLQGHLDSGASKVVLTSSPEKPGEIPLVLCGINDDVLDSGPEIVALGSNTSNAAAPILSILDEAFGLDRVYMTVVKAMSNAGRLADVPTDAYRTSRAAGENIIPAETNSAEIITQALPDLAGKLMVTALNVPVPDGSTIDMVAETSQPVTADEVNDRIKGEVASKYSHVIEFVADPIVSSDVRLNSHSGIYDSLATMVTGDNLLKTITWFNNGWGYSHRVVEVAAVVAAGGGSQ